MALMPYQNMPGAQYIKFYLERTLNIIFLLSSRIRPKVKLKQKKFQRSNLETSFRKESTLLDGTNLFACSCRYESV
jgi:hypothetical protein